MPDISGLRGAAFDACKKFLQQFPNADITSTKRNLEDQCRAMAGNVIYNRKWIMQTYAPSAARDACQAWVDANPNSRVPTLISGGLFGVLQPMSEDQLQGLSWHLSGDAFDVFPDGDQNKIICLGSLVSSCEASGGTAKFLQAEGGLTRWHWQGRYAECLP
jgi:hypothetical protein